MDELLKTMSHASEPTNIMEYVRKLEGIINHERAERDQRIREEVKFMTVGRFTRWLSCGIALGGILEFGLAKVFGWWICP